jgi:hypothetical protein
MKRVVFLMVLMMTPVVNAITVPLQLSVNGEKYPVDSEIWLKPSETIELDIWAPTNIATSTGEEWILTVDVTMGDIDGGFSAHPSTTIFGPTGGVGSPATPPGEEGIWGKIFNAEPEAIPVGTVLADRIIFHCVCLGDAVISLWQANGDSVPVNLFDRVIIHQIPEPATMALLGLGAILLLNRRR